eukprot:gene4653-3353_t
MTHSTSLPYKRAEAYGLCQFQSFFFSSSRILYFAEATTKQNKTNKKQSNNVKESSIHYGMHREPVKTLFLSLFIYLSLSSSISFLSSVLALCTRTRNSPSSC